MYFFRPPPEKLSWPFVAITFITQTICFHVFRAILLLHMHSTFKLGDAELYEVVYRFDTMYFIFFGFGAILLEHVSDKRSFILLLIFVSVPAQLIFYKTSNASLALLTYLFVAAFSSTIKVGLIAHGAAEYATIKCDDICSYFAIIYIVELIGYFMALRFVKRDMLITNNCGTLTCSTYGMLIIMMFQFIAFIEFNLTMMSDPTKSSKPISTGLFKLLQVLVVFAPFILVWINYGDGVWRWMDQAKFMNCNLFWHKLTGDDMLTFELFTSIICGIIYLIFTNSKCILRKPILLIGIGGFLMSGSIIQSSYMYATLKDGYETTKPSNNTTNFYFAVSCYCDVTFPYNCNHLIQLNSIEFILIGPGVHVIEWNLQPNKSCITLNVNSTLLFDYPDVDYLEYLTDLHNTFEICLKGRGDYLVIVKRGLFFLEDLNYDLSGHHFNGNRDLYNRPKLCVINLFISDSQLVTDYSNKFIMFKLANDPGVRYTVILNENVTCLTIKEGQYNIYKDNALSYKNINFQYGGVYVVQVLGTESNNIAFTEIHKPFVHVTFWYLVQIIILAVFGKCMVIVTGMYVIYVQSPASVRTIAIGCWCLIYSSGIFISSISSGVAQSSYSTSFIFTGILIMVMTVLFLILATMCISSNFTCDDTPYSDLKELPVADSAVASPLPTHPAIVLTTRKRGPKPKLRIEYHHRMSVLTQEIF